MTVAPYTQTTLTLDGARDVVDGWTHQVRAVADLAAMIAGTDFVPKGYRGSDAAVAAAILAGREIGLGPMTSLQHLYVIDGRPAMSAQMMRALVFAHGHTIRFVEYTSTRVVLAGRRRGSTEESPPVVWSAEEVRRAGIATRANWQHYPRAMLLARATGEICRRDFPDVIGGLSYTVEEVEDMPAEAAAATPRTRTVRRAALAERSPEASAPAMPAPRVDPEPSRPANPRPAPGGEAPPLPDVEDYQAEVRAARAERAEVQNGPQTPAEPQGDQPPPDEDDRAADARKPATAKQLAHLFALLTDLGKMEPRGVRISTVSALIGRRITTMSAVTRAEASPLIDTLIRATQDPTILDPLVDEGWRKIRAADGTTTDAAGAPEEPPLWEDE